VDWFLTLSWAGKLLAVFVLGLFCGMAVMTFLVAENVDTYLELHGCPAPIEVTE
jgi:hypothetical protein